MSYDTILAKSPSIIFQPGGTPGANLVATNWAEVQAFIALRQGTVIVYVDDGIAPCHVPASSGVTNCQGRVEIRPYREDAQNFSVLTIDPGATLKGLLKLSGTIGLVCNPTGAVPSLDFDYTPNVVGTPIPVFFIEDNAALATAATATNPACVVPVGAQLNVIMQNFAEVVAGSASAVFQVSAGSTLLMQARYSVFGSFVGSIPSTWVQGPGTFELSFDAGTANFSNLPGTVIGPGHTFTNAATNNLVAVEGDTSTFAGAATSTGISTQVVFVRANGSDTFNNGSRDFPYATIQRALTAITDASINKRYIVDVGPGEYPAAFNFKPWVSIQGHPNSSGFAGTTEVTAAAGAVGLDPSFVASGYSVFWASHLVFSNQLTLNYSALANQQIQGTFFDVNFNGGGGVGFQFIGAGTGGVDNWTLDNCLVYGGGLAQGVQFLFTIGGTQFLGGTLTIQAAPSAGALESTTWLAQNTAVGAAFSPTNVHILWAAPSPVGALAKADLCNTAIVGTVTLDGVNTSFKATGMRPASVVQTNGAPAPILQPFTIELSFLATTVDVLHALQVAGTLPTTGIISIALDGFGGTGGGGGGQGGLMIGPGTGGGASGGAEYGLASFDFDLSHHLDIHVGAGGAAGAGGVAAGGPGATGTDGSDTFAIDTTANVILGSLIGSAAGEGGASVDGSSPGRGGSIFAGERVTGVDNFAFEALGFARQGGQGQNAGGNGQNGGFGLVSFNVPGGGPTRWSGGLGGAGVAGEGGPGGGGGAGPYANGASGGVPTATNGGPGGPSTPNMGNGAGGGAGGTTGVSTGGAGGIGTAGRARVRFAIQ